MSFDRDKIIAACRAADAVYYEEQYMIGDKQANEWIDDYLVEHPGAFDSDSFDVVDVIAAWGESFALRDMP